MKKDVKVAALGLTEHRVNYFIGNDPKKWRRDIPTYQALVYENAYAGIDLKFYGQGRQLEYDIVVKPGADPNQVQFAYQGIKKLEVTSEGDLALVLPDGGKLLQKKPLVYQELAGQKVPVEGKFRLCQSGSRVTCGFAVAAYDKKRPLVIDPVLVYSTYLGGSGKDIGQAIAVDDTGAMYIAGSTESSNFPTSQAYQSGLAGNGDAVVIKLNPAGNALVYSTYLGGSDKDWPDSVGVDANGRACVAGVTYSSNFPTKQAFQSTYGGSSDIFVAKLNPNGNDLVYSTYLGGSSPDNYGYMAMDKAGAAYVTGATLSTDFPTVRALQGSKKGGIDAIVTKFDPLGAMVYSTYLNGSANAYGTAIAVDAAGAAYVSGATNSTDFPVKQAYQATATFGGIFVTKINPAGSAMVYSTFLGDAGGQCLGLAVDSSGAAYITGYFSYIAGFSTNFPIQNAFQETHGGNSDAIVAKLNPDGNALLYSTYLGGSGADCGVAIAVDSAGAAYITGYTSSTNFPVHQPVQKNYGGGDFDAFVTKLSPTGNTLSFSTYLGGNGADSGGEIAVDATGAVYIIGRTDSNNFPTRQPYQSNLAGSSDVFIAKLSQATQPLKKNPAPIHLLMLGDS